MYLNKSKKNSDFKITQEKVFFLLPYTRTGIKTKTPEKNKGQKLSQWKANLLSVSWRQSYQ